MNSPPQSSRFFMIRSYLQSELSHDLIAGFTVALVAIPQAMAYAMIAGVSPIYGLYTAIVPAIVAALFGSSRHLITGPTNGCALVTAAVLLPLLPKNNYVQVVSMVALLSGVLQLFLGVFHLGNIIRYVSNSVLSGFLAGASVLIIVHQMGLFVGRAHPIGKSTLAALKTMIAALPHANLHMIGIGAASLIILALGSSFSPRFPTHLFVIVGSSALVSALGLRGEGVLLVNDIDSISQAQFMFRLPEISPSDLGQIGSGSIVVALVSAVTSISISKSLSISTGQRISPSRDLIGQGMASIFGGFFQTMPAAGSLVRSAVNVDSGGRTRLAGCFSGLYVLLATLLFSSYIELIPLASLAAVVVFSAYRAVDFDLIKQTLKSRSISRFVFSTTFIAVLLLPLQTAIYLGTALSIGIFLYESSKLTVSYLIPKGQGDFLEQSLDTMLRNHPAAALINLEGEFHFAAVYELESNWETILNAGARVLVLRLRHTNHLASTGVVTLQHMITEAQTRGIRILICGVTRNVEKILQDTGIISLIGKEQEFPASNILLASTRLAMQRALEIANGDNHPGNSSDTQ